MLSPSLTVEILTNFEENNNAAGLSSHKMKERFMSKPNLCLLKKPLNFFINFAGRTLTVKGLSHEMDLAFANMYG